MTDHTLPRPAVLPEVIAPGGATVARRAAAPPAPRVIDVQPTSVQQVRPRSRKRLALAIAAPSTLALLASSGWVLARVDAAVHLFMWVGIVAAGAVVVALLILAALSRRKCPGLHCAGCKD
jgi:hypothetical protein